MSMVSAITNQGKIYWKLFDGSINSEKFLEFVKRLTMNKKKKIFLIVDNAKPHHSRILKEWLEKNKKKIEVYYLPSHGPDLNPDAVFGRKIGRFRQIGRRKRRDFVIFSIFSVFSHAKRAFVPYIYK